ncbi:MAG: beta-N-acetylhexosaminidase, partial [Mariprofundus sp.]
VILFGRNIRDANQVRSLLKAVRECAGSETWAAIDEEGGRVSRISWPPFCGRKQAEEHGLLYAEDPGVAKQAVYLDAQTIGYALHELGFTHNCAPVLDVFHPSGNAIIGNRSYGEDIGAISDLGLACIRGLHEAGIEAVGKHFPGHGRADADSHLSVPYVRSSLEVLLTEAEPFHYAINHGLKHVMTAHVIYTEVEEKVATMSGYWLHNVLRDRFGFNGSIWSDDLSMNGVGTDISDATRRALVAGCQVLLVCEPEDVTELYRDMPNAL